jgi:hypothetical protein
MPAARSRSAVFARKVTPTFLALSGREVVGPLEEVRRDRWAGGGAMSPNTVSRMSRAHRVQQRERRPDAPEMARRRRDRQQRALLRREQRPGQVGDRRMQGLVLGVRLVEHDLIDSITIVRGWIFRATNSRASA